MACQDNQETQDPPDPQEILLLLNKAAAAEDTRQEPCQDTNTHKQSKEPPDHVDPQEAQEPEEHKV